MSIFAWITLIVLLGKLVCLMRNLLPGDVIAYSVIGLLILTGALSTEAALGCFSNASVVLIGVLSILVAGLVHTGAIHWIVKNLMGIPASFVGAIFRLMMPVGVLSAFLSNTALTAMFINVVKVWSKRLGLAPSHLLIPLSYAATVGGVCTIIGTPANLVFSSYYEKLTGEPMDFFVTLVPGLVCLVVCTITTILMRNMLPKRKSPEESFESSTDYTVELTVPALCDSVGQTVDEAGLLNVPGGHLVEIVRFDREIISPVPADEFVLGNDHLVYSGEISSILELKRTHGLVNANNVVFNTTDVDKGRKLQMAMVDVSSPLIGRKMCESNFEDKYNVVLVAVAREGERMSCIPREVELRAGDTLLLEGDRLVAEDFEGNLNFFNNIALPRLDMRTLLSSLIMIGMVLLSVFRVMPLLNSAMLAAMLMFVTRCCNVEQLQQSINWKLIMSFAGSVCLGAAIYETGLSALIAHGLASMVGSSVLPTLIILCTLATFLTEFVSNTTAAAIFGPIALSSASSLGVDVSLFCAAIMVSVSCSFASPMGSDTNLMVYGPGGYRFSDFIRIGLPMNIVMLIANITVVYLMM